MKNLLWIGVLVASPGIIQAAGNAKSSSQVVLDVPCSEVFERGIDKQENLRATLIRVGCGLDAPGEASEAAGQDSVLDYANLNVITGTETFPHVTQSESMVWSSPDNQTIVVNYNDSNTAPSNYSGVSVSFDGGQTFTRLLPSPFATGHGTNFGDPIVVYNNALNKWFAGDLATGCGGQGTGLWTSDDAMTWTPGACAHNGGGDDRESMWVDNNAGSPFYGRMYISWNDFAAGQSIFVVRSDNGTTWSAPVRVNTGGAFIRNIQLTGSPGDDGTVFIGGMDEGGGGVNNRINYIYRSLDGGVTWTQIQQGPPFPPPGQALCGYFAAIPPIWRHMGWGQPAVGPSGVVHYAYAARGANAGDLGDILYIRSEDNGTTWSAPITLNSDAGAGGNRAQWMPSVSSTPEGNVVVTWFDRRSTTDNSYEYWIIRSSDNGLTWGSDEPISDVISPQPEQPDPSVQGCYAGDYNYQSATSAKTWVTWTDGRVQVSGHNQQDVFFTMVDQATGGGTLQGTVTDTTGAVVVGARVQAVGPVTRNASTNRDGVYRFIGLPPGTYDMTVTAPDYNQATATGVVVAEGQTTTQDFVLTGQGILEGTATDSQGMVIAGARVQAVGPVTRTTMTDSNGFYRLRLVVGTYDVTVSIFAYDPATANVQINDGMTTSQNFTLTLSPAHSVSGTITSGVTGLPVPNTTVRVLNTPIPPVTSDQNGMYQIPSVPEGTYDLRASPPPGTGLTPRTVSIVVDMDITVDFVLDAAALTVNFEPPDYQGSASGTRVAGQQGWYVPPIAGSTDQLVFTYDGNALGLAPNPNGDTQFLGARTQGADLARGQLNYDWSATSVWTVSYDLAARFNGTPPPVDYIGSFSLQDSVTSRSFIQVNSWGTNVQGTMWDADYLVYNADGSATPPLTPGPEWHNLAVNHWYRQTAAFDFDSNRILSVSITDLDTGVTATVTPTNWYLLGGATGRPPLPTALRFFTGGGVGNIVGYDNLVIVSGAPGDKPGPKQSHSPQVKPLVPGAETN
jgi:hypothetical protein